MMVLARAFAALSLRKTWLIHYFRPLLFTCPEQCVWRRVSCEQPLDMSPTSFKAAYNKMFPKKYQFQKTGNWWFSSGNFVTKYTSEYRFASKSLISDEINLCSLCMCILRCFSERASKLQSMCAIPENIHQILVFI